MAINLNHLQYGAQFKAFTDFAAGQRDQGTIVRLEGPGQGMPGPNGEPRVILAKQGDCYGHVWRNDDSKAINNNVRDLFLRSILAVCGVARIDQLPENVQAVMKADDYRGGHPLTARRITAVKNAIDANLQAEANAAQTMIEDQLFYDEAVSRTVAGGRSKEDCDATIKAMFDAVGDDGSDRKYLAELLAHGKPAFLSERGRLPSHDDAVAFARDVKAVLDLAKQCRASFAEPYGGIVAETILSTLKTMERIVRADELEQIDADLGARLYDAAGELDTSDMLAPPKYNAHIVKGLNEKLENFQEQVDAKFESVFPGNGGSPFMQAVKKNVIMNLAFMGAGHKARPLALALEEYGDALGLRHDKRDMLGVIQPVLYRAPNVG